VRAIEVENDQGTGLVDTLVIDWGQEVAAVDRAATSKWPKHLRVFYDALNEALIDTEHSIAINGILMAASDREAVRAEYFKRWAGDGNTPEQRHENSKKGYNRAVKAAQAGGLTGSKPPTTPPSYGSRRSNPNLPKGTWKPF
jgi:hypothetical protein